MAQFSITIPFIDQVEELLADRVETYRYLVCGNYKVLYVVNEIQKHINISDVFDARQNPIKIKRKK